MTTVYTALKSGQTVDIYNQCIIFAPSQILLASKDLCESLSDRYQIPPFLWTSAWQRSNGSFGCEISSCEQGNVQSSNTWLRFQVKQLLQTNIRFSPHPYEWYEMSFITHSAPGIARIVLCLDIPTSLQCRIRTALSPLFLQPHKCDPCSVYIPLIYDVITLYDNSVWGLRDAIRAIEKIRSTADWSEEDLHTMHELVRHADHSSETLEVALNTVLSLSRQHELSNAEQHPGGPHSGSGFRKAQQQFSFQILMLRGLLARSQSIEARLRNEINLAFNLVAQRNSRTMVRVSDDTRSDGAATKTIAILTLVFLPATFLSSVFSMSFFSFSPKDVAKPAWTVSERIWIYWAIAIPLTIIIVTSWIVWGRRAGFLKSL